MARVQSVRYALPWTLLVLLAVGVIAALLILLAIGQLSHPLV
jgi:hypothetical protein